MKVHRTARKELHRIVLDEAPGTVFENEDREHIEQETVVFLLNETGEIIIQQGLNNNSTLLGQISDMTSDMKKKIIYAKFI